MPSIDSVIERWLDRLEGTTSRPNLRGANVYSDRDTLYSYGSHFPLAEWYPRARGRRRPMFLLNGDRSTVSTTRHQGHARDAISRRADRLGAQVLIVPFSALEGAGILRDTVLPLEIRGDRWDRWREPVPGEWDNVQWSGLREPSGRWDGHQWDPTGGTVTERGTIPGNTDGSAARTWRRYDYDARQFVDVDEPSAASLYHRGSSVEWDTELGWSIERTRHWLGGSLFTAVTRETRVRRRPVAVRDVIRAAVHTVENQSAARARTRRDRVRLDRLGDATGALETLRDPLALLDPAGTVRETETVRRRRRYVSSFDVNEPAPLYFLATLPSSSRARTVESAIQDLAPAAVHAAIARGRHVERQGDIFAIETDMHDAALAGFPRARLTLETRSARPRPGEPGYAAPLTAGDRRRILRRARALWHKHWTVPALEPVTPKGGRRQSGRILAQHRADLERHRAIGRAAIFGALPTARLADGTYGPSERARAYQLERARNGQDGARRRIRLEAQHRGAQRDTYRDRSIGGRQTHALDLWRRCVDKATHELRPALEPGALERARRDTRAILSIHGTAHTATEVVRAPGGRVYIRGAMIHAPAIIGERRERDHIRRPLRPGVWYLAVRNTVPRASADTTGARR